MFNNYENWALCYRRWARITRNHGFMKCGTFEIPSVNLTTKLLYSLELIQNILSSTLNTSIDTYNYHN